MDGHEAARITSLANAGELIESARLGQVTRGPRRTTGNLFLDDFMSTS